MRHTHLRLRAFHLLDDALTGEVCRFGYECDWLGRTLIARSRMRRPSVAGYKIIPLLRLVSISLILKAGDRS